MKIPDFGLIKSFELINLFIYLFTTLFNVGHTIVTRLIKNQLNKKLILT